MIISFLFAGNLNNVLIVVRKMRRRTTKTAAQMTQELPFIHLFPGTRDPCSTSCGVFLLGCLLAFWACLYFGITTSAFRANLVWYVACVSKYFWSGIKVKIMIRRVRPPLHRFDGIFMLFLTWFDFPSP